MKLPVLAILLMAAAAAETRIETLYDDTVSVGPNRFRTLDLSLPEEPARVICSFEVIQGGSGVRAVLIRSEDAERWLRGEAHQVEAATPFARRGAFSHKPSEPDHYLIVLDNRLEGRTLTEVHLVVRVVHGDGPAGPISQVDPRKGQILVWSTMAVFAVVSVYSGREIHRRSRLNGPAG